MPPLSHQHRKLGNTFTARFVVMRLLTWLDMSYDAAVKSAEPYNRVAEVFGGTKPKADAPDPKVLHAKIGQLTLENDFLEGALTKAGLLSAKR